jgi:hypothetical protein
MDFFGNEGNLMDKYEKSQVIFSNNCYPHKKINGKVILENVPEFDKLRLGSTLYYFLNHVFEDKIERDYFLLTSTERKIFDYFLETTAEILD